MLPPAASASAEDLGILAERQVATPPVPNVGSSSPAGSAGGRSARPGRARVDGSARRRPPCRPAAARRRQGEPRGAHVRQRDAVAVEARGRDRPAAPGGVGGERQGEQAQASATARRPCREPALFLPGRSSHPCHIKPARNVTEQRHPRRGFLHTAPAAYTRALHARTRSSRARLPARPARGGARLRGDLRGLARGGRVHRGVRREGHGGPLRRPPAADLLPPARAPDVAHVQAAAAALPACDRVVRPARIRHRDLVLERLGARRARRSRRGPRLLLPQPVPLRLDRARGDAARAQPAHAAGAAAAAQPLAPVGLDRRPARRSLRRQLAPDGGARAPLLRPRGDRALPAGRDRPLRAGAGRRALHGARGADGAQAHRRRRAGVRRARAAAAGGRRRA